MEKKEEIKTKLGEYIGEMLNSDMECILELDEKVKDIIMKNEKDYITLSVNTIDKVIENRLDEIAEIVKDKGIKNKLGEIAKIMKDSVVDGSDLDELFYNNVYKIIPCGFFESMISELIEYDAILYVLFISYIDDLVKIHIEEDK